MGPRPKHYRQDRGELAAASDSSARERRNALVNAGALRANAIADTLTTVPPLFAPFTIEAIFDKPGAVWTREERDLIATWLNSSVQLDVHLRLTLWHQGRGTTHQDAEDTWQEFCLHEFSSVVQSYVPSKGLRFRPYVQFCLKRYCWRKASTIRRTREFEQPPDNARDPDNDASQQWTSRLATPEQALQRAQLEAAIRRCVEKLPPDFREVIERHYFREEFAAAIADDLAIGLSLVKVRLFRARQLLGRCLGSEPFGLRRQR